MDVNSIYGSTFSQGNTSSGHFQNTISSNTSTFFDAGNVMLPSPIYGAKELNYYLHQPHQQHSLQTQQEDTIISQIPTNIKQEISISHQNPPNELKPEYFSVQSELGMVTVPEAQRFYINYLEKNFNPHNISYPPTPTTPHNEKYLSEGFPIITPTELNVSPVVFNPPTIITLSQQQQAEMFYEQGHYFLHVAKPRNTTLAFSRFEAAASLGSNRGKHQLAYCLQHGIGVVKDEKKAVEIYLKIADDHPNPATLCQLGICFQMGVGVEVDASRAVQYYERAVLMGHTDAMFNLAYCLRCGIGTPVNPERACELYYRMAELGDPQGMKLLGNCKSIGLGTVKDEREALEWFRRSSESDIYWGGKIQYALYLFEGIGTVQNWFEAFNLIRDVCENFPLCPGPNKILLGRFYHFGIGCEVDFEKALYWYERALRSYYMQLCSVQECEMLINDIRNRQSQNSTMPMFLGGTGNEQMIGESAIRQDGNY